MSGLTDEQIAYISGKIDLPFLIAAVALIALALYLSFRQTRQSQARPMTEEERREYYDADKVVEPWHTSSLKRKPE